jgi:hypothetical protein
MQSEFLQKVGLVLIFAWEMEWRGGRSGVATSLCILSEECLRYCLTICWFFALGDCHATNMPNCSSCTFPPKILLEHHEQEGLNGILAICSWCVHVCSLNPFLQSPCISSAVWMKNLKGEPQTYTEMALDTSLAIHHILQFWWWRAYLYMVGGFAGVSLMSPPVSVYDSSTNSSLEVLSCNNFKMDLLVWTYVAGESVSANTTCMQPTYQSSSGPHPWTE